jgi:hypothetical protein
MNLSLEARLTEVEKAIVDLQKQVSPAPETNNWLEAITGSFKDEPEFEAVLNYGQKIRQQDELSVEIIENS